MRRIVMSNSDHETEKQWIAAKFKERVMETTEDKATQGDIIKKYNDHIERAKIIDRHPC